VLAAGQTVRPRPGRRHRCLAALAELRDPASLPAIIDRLESEDKQVALTARSTLLTLAGDDLGPKRRRWLDWWEKMQHRPRLEWLLEALAHRDPQIRLAASQELQEITGEYFGYHYDLPNATAKKPAAVGWSGGKPPEDANLPRACRRTVCRKAALRIAGRGSRERGREGERVRVGYAGGGKRRLRAWA